MWELIRINKRNSVLLLTTMAVCLLTLGVIIGMAVAGPNGGTFGLLIAGGIWLILSIISFSSGDQILLSASNAVPVTHDVHPQLFNVVEEMSIAAGLPMPKVYIINDPAPNAFATGRNPKSASIAVTAGLLAKMNRDELQGVVAHEMSHILHRDILYVTLAGIMLGAVAMLSQIFLRSMFYSSLGGSRRRYSGGGKGGGGVQAPAGTRRGDSCADSDSVAVFLAIEKTGVPRRRRRSSIDALSRGIGQRPGKACQ
jgi:heat shock protein HtpX